MKKIVLLFATFYGAFGVLFGALGAHALKKVLSPELLSSFNTGVRYQIYHSIVMLIIGFYLSFETRFEEYIGLIFIVGTFLFSFSIYFLTMSNVWSVDLKYLGPLTPLGGMLLIIGWILLGVFIYKQF